MQQDQLARLATTERNLNSVAIGTISGSAKEQLVQVRGDTPRVFLQFCISLS